MDKILVINPGSTSTKIAMYDGRKQLWQENLEHDPEYIKTFKAIYDQLDFRHKTIVEAVEKHGDKLSELVAVVSRGGLLPPPLPAGRAGRRRKV